MIVSYLVGCSRQQLSRQEFDDLKEISVSCRRRVEEKIFHFGV